MDLNRLTQKSQEALSEAQNRAIELGHQEVDGEHLLISLLEQKEGLIPRLLERLGVASLELRDAIEQDLQKRPRVSGPGAQPGNIVITRRLSKLLVDAEKEAKRLKDEYVSVEHLFLAMLKEDTTSSAGRMLKEHKVTEDRFLKSLTDVRGNQRVQSAHPEHTYEALERYGRELVKMARDGKLDPVIGRDEEIRRVVRILSRKTKNNPS